MKSEIVPVHHVPDRWKIFNRYRRQRTGCTVRHYLYREISISLVITLLVNSRKGSEGCTSVLQRAGELKRPQYLFRIIAMIQNYLA